MIVPINVGEVTSAVVQMFEEHPDIGQSNVTVERSTEPTEDPGTEGWVGVFKGSVTFPPRTLGYGSGYREQIIRLAASVRMSGFETGEDGETALENLVQKVVSCLLSDCTLRGTVLELSEDFEVQYPTLNSKEEEFLQVANVFFEAIARVQFVEG